MVGCKLDLRDERDQTSLEEIMSPIMQNFREIETCVECSAATMIQVCIWMPPNFVAWIFLLGSTWNLYLVCESWPRKNHRKMVVDYLVAGVFKF